MLNKKGQKRFVLNSLIVVAVIVFLMLVAIWAGFGHLTYNKKAIEMTLTSKLMITFGALIVLIISWMAFKHQENLDKRKELNASSYAKK